MSSLHIVVMSMDKSISFECDKTSDRKIPFKKNRRLSTHIVRSYSTSQFENSSTNSNSNILRFKKLIYLIRGIFWQNKSCCWSPKTCQLYYAYWRLHTRWSHQSLSWRLHARWSRQSLSWRLHKRWSRQTLNWRLHARWSRQSLSWRLHKRWSR